MGNSNTVELIDFMTYVDRMELEAKVEKIRANKQRNQELEERAQALVDEEDKQERERKQGQQKKQKEESVAESGMMAVLYMMMAQQAQQTQCMMQGFQGFATMLAGVSGMAGSSSAATATTTGATTGPPPLPPPTSSKLGGGDIGAPPPAQASGVPLGNQGLINRRYNRGFLVRNRRGEGHVIKGSGTVTRHGGMAFPALTCLQIRRVSSLHIPSLVQTIVGSRPLLAEAFTKGAIARQVLAGHLPDVHLLATTHNEDTPALPLGLITPSYYRNDAFDCHKDIHKEVDYVVEPIGTNLASSTARGKGLPPLVSRGRSSNRAEQQHHMSEGALPDPTAAILAIPQTQEVANLFSLTAVVVSSDRRHAMFPLSGVDSVPTC